MQKKNKLFMAVEYGIIVVVILYFANKMLYTLSFQEIPYSSFQYLVEKGEVNEVRITPDRIYIESPNDKMKGTIIKRKIYTERIPLENEKLLEYVKSNNIVLFSGEQYKDNKLEDVIITWVIPLLIFGALGKYILDSIDKKIHGEALDFGKSSLKIYAQKDTGTKFGQVAGQEEAKESLKEIVQFLNEPERFTRIGARIPKGALLIGPPGTGKTLIARAVAGEANVPFFSISGSEFVQMFAGLGATKVRDMFKQAQKKAPCIVFIDEIDAVGKKRGSDVNEGNEEREQTLNQLLTEMDGFDSSKGVVILAATNRVDVLDKALLRPGRFDRRIVMDKPDYHGRQKILSVHLKGVEHDEKIDIKKIAKITPGAVGADLANIINEGALRALRDGDDRVREKHLEAAVEEVLAGSVRKKQILTEEEKYAAALHEAGHALAGVLLNSEQSVHKISIMQRTFSNMGITLSLSKNSRSIKSYKELMDSVVILLSGRAAEEVVLMRKNTGSEDDIKKATHIVRGSIIRFGMSEEFGMTYLHRKEEVDFEDLGSCSDRTEYEVDMKVIEIIKERHKKACSLMESHKDVLLCIADGLMERETLGGDEFLNILKQNNLKV